MHMWTNLIGYHSNAIHDAALDAKILLMGDFFFLLATVKFTAESENIVFLM